MSTPVDPKGKVALVTGSSAGIGLSTAHLLAKRGVNVILHGSRDQSLVAESIEEIRSKYGVRADYVRGDLTKLSDIKTIWEEVLSLYNDGVDILINNAGSGFLNTLENFEDEQYDFVIALNLSAPFHLTKRCLPGMKKKGWGRIVNVSSVAGLVSRPEFSVYSASKHGLIGFTKGVALETAQCGITCNAVCPAFVETQLAAKVFEHMISRGFTAAELEKSLYSTQVTGSLIKPEQVAELIEFLCLSNASSQMTGAVYTIDSGMTAQ